MGEAGLEGSAGTPARFWGRTSPNLRTGVSALLTQRCSAAIPFKISVLRRQPRLPILEKRVFWRERKVRRPWKTLV
jgi:hypothetical protein